MKKLLSLLALGFVASALSACANCDGCIKKPPCEPKPACCPPPPCGAK